MTDKETLDNLSRLLNKGGRYLLAFSGGPDSVYLLECLASLYKDQLSKHVYLAYVNYHDSDEVDKEQDIVFHYIYKYHLEFFKANTKYREQYGNFEDWAREYRYTFFKKVIKKEELTALLTAHHQTDLLETYVLQKKRQNLPLYYGLPEKTALQNMTIIRPLLGISKNEIYKRLKEENCCYYEDKTNQDQNKQRNVLRKTGFDEEESSSLLEEIKKKNNELEAFYKKISSYGPMIPFASYLELSEEEQRRLLFYILNKAHLKVAEERLTGLGKESFEFLKRQENGEMKLDLFKALYRTKNEFFIGKYTKSCSYTYKFNYAEKKKNPYFELNLTKPELFNIHSFPVVIRNYQEGDKISTDLPTKDVLTLLRKQKVPFYLIPLYPVFLVKDKIVYVPFYSDILEKKLPMKLFLFENLIG